MKSFGLHEITSTDIDSLSTVLWEAVHVQDSRVDGATWIILSTKDFFRSRVGWTVRWSCISAERR